MCSSPYAQVSSPFTLFTMDGMCARLSHFDFDAFFDTLRFTFDTSPFDFDTSPFDFDAFNFKAF